MPIMTLKDLTVSFGLSPLFQGVNLQIDAGEHIALVGRNGAGKSTFLKILSGDISPDGGVVQCAAGCRIAMVSQTVPLGLTGCVYDVVATGLAEIGALLQAYHVVSLKLADTVTEALLAEQATLSEKIDATEGWSLHQKIQTILTTLDLNGDVEMSELSGGLKRRVLLARALVSDPDLLLLDEPTNHLDIEAVLWLENFLKNYSKTFILITHDRQFMANLATRIIEIDYQTIHSWPGNYARYCSLKEAMIDAYEKEQALFDKRLAAEEVWIRQGVKARRTRNEGRVRRLEALRREKNAQFKKQGQSHIEVQSGRLSGKTVFEIEDLSFSFADKKIIERFSAIVGRGDCVGIVGPNGAGKSTLIKLLLGDLAPSAGSIRQGTNLEIAYFDQYRLSLDDKASLIDNVGMGREKISINGKDKHVISYLQDFLFTPDRARVKASVLSGGEKNRLLLAKLFSKPANVIVMDEPTNDLDIETLELLEEKLSEFQGTLMIISHDRAFLDNVTTQLWVLQPNGRIVEYVSGQVTWTDIVTKKTLPSKNAPVATIEKKPEKQTQTPEARRELNAVLKKITQHESKIQAIHDEMAKSDYYQQAQDKIKAQAEVLAALEKALEALYLQWEALE